MTRILLFPAVCLPLLLSCGYQAGSLMPDGVSSVAVELAGNETRPETRYHQAEVTYTNLLTREFLRRSQVRVRPAEEADIIVRSQIIRMERVTLVEDRRDFPSNEGLWATVRVEVVDGKSGRPFMAPFDLSRMSDRIIGRQEGIETAILEVMGDLARDTVNRIQAESFYRTHPAPDVSSAGR